MAKIACSRCGVDADVMAVYKRRILCFTCLAHQRDGKLLAKYLLHYLSSYKPAQAPPPGLEPFGDGLGMPLKVWRMPAPRSGGHPQLIKKARLKKVKTSVWVGALEWTDPED